MGEARRGHQIEHPFGHCRPARRIGAITSFLPEIVGDRVTAIGVSTSISSVGSPRVTS